MAMQIKQQISACLWFDNQAEEAAQFYVSVFPSSKVVAVTRYGNAGHEIHGRPAGSVMTVEFELSGLPFTALNGGPVFKFNEAVSFQVLCDTQKEIDSYWAKLSEGGDPKAQQCGWLKDRFGLSWQVAPKGMAEMLKEPGSPAAERAMTALLKMKKIDLAELKRAFTG
jgi:predicted 3-demethylubiquinone-9 3-methyltransferase (glyoxalase superfamily)